MLISDWSSDVCSSGRAGPALRAPHRRTHAGDFRPAARLGGDRLEQRRLDPQRRSLRPRHAGRHRRQRPQAQGCVAIPHAGPGWPERSRHLMSYTLTIETTGDEVEVAEGQTILDACRSEEHTSELQSLMRISYAVFCLKKKT